MGTTVNLEKKKKYIYIYSNIFLCLQYFRLSPDTHTYVL